VWDELRSPATPDAIALATGASLSRVLSMLVDLELSGLVVQAGGRYRRRLRTTDR
jgi:predicted Rossmann fold nucleotide-binding protein DprA/Smf involved in DNA uptake